MPQWNFKPAPDRWSVAECMEHIAAAEDYIRGMIIEKVMVAHAPPASPDRDVAKIDAGIIANVPDRSNKVQAPEALKPTNRFGSPQGSIDRFVESRAKTGTFSRPLPVFAIMRSTALAMASMASGTRTSGSCLSPHTASVTPTRSRK